MMTIFLKKMVIEKNFWEINTLVLISSDFENDRPVGRSFSRNLEIEMFLDLAHLGDFRDFLKKSRKSKKIDF